MHNISFPSKKVKLCKILNNEIYAKFKISKHLCSEFEVNKVLRQGDAIVHSLFNIVLDNVIGRSEEETLGIIFDKCSQIKAYPNDVVIMGGRLKDVEEVLVLLV
jgi:sorting nexin-29